MPRRHEPAYVFGYRGGLGTSKRGGENVHSHDWAYPLEICFFAATSIAKKLTERLGGNPRPFLTDAFSHKFQVALKRLRKETAEADYFKKPEIES